MFNRSFICLVVLSILLLSTAVFSDVIVREVSLTQSDRMHALSPQDILDGVFEMNMGCGVFGAFDIVFAIDSTGSMGGELTDVKSTINAFADAMVAEGYDYAFGGVTFGDGCNVWDFDESTPDVNDLTTSVTEFRTLLDPCNASGGADGPETSLDAIYQAINDYNWRPFAVHIVIMFTDIGTCAFDHPDYPTSSCCCDEETEITSTEVLDAVLTSGTYVYSLFPERVRTSYTWSYNRYVGLASATGGETYDLDEGFATIFDDVITHFADFANITIELTNTSGETIDSVYGQLIVNDSSCVTPLASIDKIARNLEDGDNVSFGWPINIDSTCFGGDRCFNIAIASSDGYADTIFGCTTTEDCHCIGPEGHVMMPTPELRITACEDQTILMNVRGAIEPHTLDEGTVELTVDGVAYTTDDDELTLADSLISFNPVEMWEDGDTITFCLTDVADINGCPMEEPICSEFIVDLDHPHAEGPRPLPDSSFFTDDFEVEFGITDNIAGIDTDASFITINGDTFGLDSEYITYDGGAEGGALNIAGSATSDFGFETLDTAEVCFHGADLIDGAWCGPNEGIECFRWPIMLLTRTVWFEEHQTSPCDTILIPLWMDTTEVRQINAANFELQFNPDILVPINLVYDSSLTDGWTGTYDIDPEAATFSADISGETIDAGMGGVFIWVKCYVPCHASGGDFCNLDIVDFEFNEGFPMVDYYDGIFIATWNVQTWIMNLKINRVEPRLRDLDLAIGASAHTTDGYEPGSDLVIVPPTPDYVNSWLQIDDPRYPHITGLRRDMRAMEPPVRWVIHTTGVESEGEIRWNPTRLPEGNFTLNDIVDMKEDTIAYFTIGETDSIVIEWTTPDFATSNAAMCAGWNLVSLSTVPPSMEPSQVFPFSPVGAYGYNTQRRLYEEIDRFSNGVGYWVFASSDTVARVAGIPLESYNLNLHRGWNIIGSLSEPVAVDDICTTLDDVIIGDIYGYDCETYTAADTLFPGHGYWVMVTDNTILSVPSGGMYCKSYARPSSPEWDFGVNIDDERIMLGYSADADISLDHLDIVMPPALPNESAGEAFASRSDFRLRRDVSSVKSWTINVPHDADLTFDIPESIGNLMIELPSGDKAITNDTRISNLEGGLYRIFVDNAPMNFELIGAYPNPFNSQVAISWIMPEEGRATVDIYDVMGHKVETILDENAAHGKNTVEWNADGLQSGVYFYRITTGSHSIDGSISFIK
ncbi:MAG: T9SS type A sorting domain-containing protein [Candidatus Zixiibacteriota bacterium]